MKDQGQCYVVSLLPHKQLLRSILSWARLVRPACVTLTPPPVQYTSRLTDGQHRSSGHNSEIDVVSLFSVDVGLEVLHQLLNISALKQITLHTNNIDHYCTVGIYHNGNKD